MQGNRSGNFLRGGLAFKLLGKSRESQSTGIKIVNNAVRLSGTPHNPNEICGQVGQRRLQRVLDRSVSDVFFGALADHSKIWQALALLSFRCTPAGQAHALQESSSLAICGVLVTRHEVAIAGDKYDSLRHLQILIGCSD
jgi:hypothetical protein